MVDDTTLEALLAEVNGSPSAALSFTSRQFDCLLDAFIPSHPPDYQAKAYIILSSFFRPNPKRAPSRSDGELRDAPTYSLIKTRLYDHLQRTDDDSLVACLSFWSAIFQVNPEIASSLFAEEGMLELVMDCISLPASSKLSPSLARLLGHACGQAVSRALINVEALRWLEKASDQLEDKETRCAASLALSKYLRSRTGDSATSGSDPPPLHITEDALLDTMKQVVVESSKHQNDPNSALEDAVEGLAYLSSDPAFKVALTEDKDFLKSIFQLPPALDRSVTVTPLIYGILVISCNICMYRPVKSDEQNQLERLKRMAKPGTGKVNEENSLLDEDSAVKIRVARVVESGILGFLSTIMKHTASPGIRINAGRLLLYIVTDQENRGKVLQSGGVKLLASILKHCTPKAGVNADTVDAAYLDTIQALAKLTITSSPIQVYGPNIGAIYDAVRPLSILCQHSASSLLQRFEAVMALTNLASWNPDVASRIGNTEGLVNKVEILLLEDHQLLRRATMELLCNLISGSELIFQRYSQAQSRLQIILALCDVEDIPTRMAASGALAILTDSAEACLLLLQLQIDRHRVLAILNDLVSSSQDSLEGENSGLIHRGVICTYNILRNAHGHKQWNELRKEADTCRLTSSISKISKGSSSIPGLVDCAKEVVAILA